MNLYRGNFMMAKLQETTGFFKDLFWTCIIIILCHDLSRKLRLICHASFKQPFSGEFSSFISARALSLLVCFVFFLNWLSLLRCQRVRATLTFSLYLMTKIRLAWLLSLNFLEVENMVWNLLKSRIPEHFNPP